MSLFSGKFPMRQSLVAFCIAVALPIAAALNGCGEAPKLPGAPSSEVTKSQGPAAGAPASSDDAETASGGEGEPPAVAEPPPGDTSGGIGSPPPQTDADVKAPEEQARNAAEELARHQLEQQNASRSRVGTYYDKAAAPPSPKKTAPPPPPVPAPTAEAPKPAATPGTGSGSGGLGAGGASRGLGHADKPAAPVPDKPKTFDVVPVYYGTDRSVEPNAKRLQFGPERGHKLQLGRALVTVPTVHKVPTIERPWVVEIPYFKYKVYEEAEDPDKHFTMQEIAALTKEQLLVYVKERLAKSARFKDHAFVFVHGFNTSFDAAIYRTAQIAYDLKFDGAPFVYSWPSGGKVASYTYDRGSAEQAEPRLAEFLDFVVKESGAKSISLIAHSMGNELLLRVLERMKTVVPKGVVISQVILAAPDVDRDKFSNIAREITQFAKGVTLYAASNDRALGYSARFWGGVPRAGDVPASGPLIIPGVDTIDVTAVSTDSLGLNHSGYAENQTLLNDIALLLQTGERPPDKRIPSLLKINSEAGIFWRYPVVVAH